MAWAFDEFVLDAATRELTRGGEVVPIEPQVYAVLLHLVENADRVVSKEELLDAVWDTRFVSESALTSRIKSARQAVGDNGRAQKTIRTFHGHGYRFVRQLEETGPADAMPRHGLPGPPRSTGEQEHDASALEPTSATLSLAVDREFPFVGRTELIERAVRLADGIAQGPQVLLLGGEPGVGKSRLAIEIAEQVGSSASAVVVGGRCEQHLASSLQPWIEALTMHVATESAERLRADTSGIIDRLSASLPQLDLRLDRQPASPATAPEEFAVIDGIVTLVERASQRRPMVIVLDDVQWAGGATRSLGSLLLRRGVANVLLILTFRTTTADLGVASAEWLAGLEAAGASRSDLGALTLNEVDELVDATLGTSAAARRDGIWERSGGHSLFAIELIRDALDGASGEGLPRSVTSLVHRRLEKLSRPVETLITTGAAFGQEFDLGLVAAVADMGDEVALDAVETALGAQLLSEVPGRVDWYRFSHQLVPAAALESMSASRRVRLHANVAAALEARSGSKIEIAHHLLEASTVLGSDEVVRRVREISHTALSEHQFDRAVELLERSSALEIDPRQRAELLTEYGAACNLAGQQPRALDALRQAADVARRNGWYDLLAAAALGMWGQSPFRASQDRTVIPLLDEAIAHSHHLDDSTRARLLAKRAAFNLFSGPFDERDRLSTEAVDLVGFDSTSARLEVLEARWMAIASPSQLSTIVELDTEIELLRKELGTLSSDACAPEISLYWRGLGRELRELSSELRDDPRQRRDVDQWRTTTLDGTFALFAGDLEEARRRTDQALPLGREPWGEAGRVVHGLVHLVTDVLDDTSSAAADNWRRIVESVPSDSMRATAAWAEARFGDRDRADDLVEQVMPRLGLLEQNFMGGFGLVGLGEAVLLLGRLDLVPELIATLEPLSGQMLGHPWAPMFAADDVGGRLHGAMGDVEAADAAATKCRELYARLGADSFARRLDDAMS